MFKKFVMRAEKDKSEIPEEDGRNRIAVDLVLTN